MPLKLGELKYIRISVDLWWSRQRGVEKRGTHLCCVRSLLRHYCSLWVSAAVVYLPSN